MNQFIYSSLRILLLAVCFWLGMYQQKIFDSKELKITYGDELPGIGNTKDHPAPCIAYWNPIDKSVHIEYAK